LVGFDLELVPPRHAALQASMEANAIVFAGHPPPTAPPPAPALPPLPPPAPPFGFGPPSAARRLAQNDGCSTCATTVLHENVVGSQQVICPRELELERVVGRLDPPPVGLVGFVGLVAALALLDEDRERDEPLLPPPPPVGF
jgi:hypothetical protein